MRIANYKLEYEVRNQKRTQMLHQQTRKKKFVIIRNHQTVEVDEKNKKKKKISKEILSK